MPTLEELTAPYGPAPQISAADVRAARTGRTRPLVVLDDHASGTQSVADLPVVTAWSREDLRWALQAEAPAVIVETGTRAMAAVDTEERDFDVTRAALAAAADIGEDIDVALRSDSTLRGHYPLETDVISACLRDDAEHSVDGLIICPAFPDAGRITVDSIHYVKGERDVYHPVHLTEYASDPQFPFDTSNIPQWIEERTRGRIGASEVFRLTLDVLRQGPDAVSNLLMQARRRIPVVVDAVTEADLRCLAVALYHAEERGRRFLFRVAPQFIRAYLGQEEPRPLAGADVEALREGGLAEGAKHGLVVVTQPTGLVDRQLRALRRRRGLREVEVKLPALADHRRDLHIDEVVARVVQNLAVDHTVLRLSREGQAGESEFRLRREVDTALLEIIRRVVAATQLRFVVARGGMIAMTVARGMGVRRAWVHGPLLPGAVSLWSAAQGAARGVPFAVYAGTIGDDESLADVVDICANTPLPARAPALSQPAVQALPAARVAVIGLGATGLPMAARLAEEHSVVAFDIDAERRQAAWRNNVAVAVSARDAAADAQLVVLNVRNLEQVHDVLFDSPDSVAEVLPAGSVVLLCTSTGIDGARQIAELLAERDIYLVDAPVSGGPDRARRGELLVAVGASVQARDMAAGVLATMAAQVVHVGEQPGDGQAMKIIQSLLTGVQVQATAEAMSLAGVLGLDRGAVVDLLRHADVGSAVVAERAGRMLRAEGTVVHKALDITLQELGIVASTAYHAGVSVPLAAAAEQTFLLAHRSGLGEWDDSAIIRLFEPEEND
ncbi:MAG: four-carbon acid sugar kinase family protein [Bowdeniella nasicola]|nr:four-carbon acid sugar kinase family protein [Bowdeniella nasicola]